jgi:Ribosomal L28e protein family.
VADTGIGNQNAYLVRRNAGGGSQFSRDPLNLVNKHSYKVRYNRLPFVLFQIGD